MRNSRLVAAWFVAIAAFVAPLPCRAQTWGGPNGGGNPPPPGSQVIAAPVAPVISPMPSALWPGLRLPDFATAVAAWIPKRGSATWQAPSLSAYAPHHAVSVLAKAAKASR